MSPEVTAGASNSVTITEFARYRMILCEEPLGVAEATLKVVYGAEVPSGAPFEGAIANSAS